MKCRWLVTAGSSLTLTRAEHFNEVSAKTEVADRMGVFDYQPRRFELMTARPATEADIARWDLLVEQDKRYRTQRSIREAMER